MIIFILLDQSAYWEVRATSLVEPRFMHIHKDGIKSRGPNWKIDCSIASASRTEAFKDKTVNPRCFYFQCKVGQCTLTCIAESNSLHISDSRDKSCEPNAMIDILIESERSTEAFDHKTVNHWSFYSMQGRSVHWIEWSEMHSRIQFPVYFRFQTWEFWTKWSHWHLNRISEIYWSFWLRDMTPVMIILKARSLSVQ